MPKYHFEIIDGFTLEDPVGLDCPNDLQAKTVAKKIARQIAEDIGGKEDSRVIVRDDDGAEVYETEIGNQQIRSLK